jgi:hypothetical protein
MPGTMTFRVTPQSQAEMDSTLRRYMQLTSRDAVTVVNTKAFYIARRAVAETPKADSSAIRRFAGLRGGEIIGKMINKRRGMRGEKGLYGQEMQEAVASVIAARLRSVSFLKSGWLPAIKALAPLADKIHGQSGDTISSRGAKQYHGPKGSASIATASRIGATIINSASGPHETHEALKKYGGPALQKAWDFEIASMRAYIEKKLAASARSLGIKLAGVVTG